MRTNLKAGKLDVIYENGFLRYISSGRDELIRMIYPAVRDAEWNTVDPVIIEETVGKEEDSFNIKLICSYRAGEIDFRAKYLIAGKQDSSISFEMEGEARATFRKNRIGLCVLHPAEAYAGKNCTIEHADGSVENSFFPEEISPHQVFLNIKSMRWLSGKINCSVTFEGDVFETEDQRNWTDASFKTYSTPLSLPYPVVLPKGSRIYQKIIFKASNLPDYSGLKEDVVCIRLLPDKRFRFPFIGVGSSSSAKPLSLKEIKILRSAGFDHYRTDIHLWSHDWIERADISHNESIELGLPLEIALFFSENIVSQAEIFVEWLISRKPDIARILLFHRDLPSTPDELAGQVIEIIRKEFPDLKFATGTNANFAQLNRYRPVDKGNDYICYSIHPQEHATDDATLVENLKAQEYTVRSTRSFAGRKGIVISPVTIQRRFNANISFIELPYNGEEVPPRIDCRQMTLFGACWTAGSLKYLCESDPDSITYYETTGERGIIQGETEPRWPGYFPSYKGMIFPVFHLFRFVLMHKNFSIIKNICSHPLLADCLSMSDDGEARLVIVNYTGAVQRVRLEGLAGMFRLTPLSGSNLGEAETNQKWNGLQYKKPYNASETFLIEPESVNFIEGWLK